MKDKIIIFDLETQNGFGLKGDLSDVKISVLASIDNYGNERIYWEENIKDFISEIENASLISGFNITGFDLPIVRNYCEQKLNKLPIYDILDEFKKVAGHRIKLDTLAKATLGTGKIGSGLDALKYWSQGEKEKLAQYCMEDVRVTKRLFDLILEGKPLKYHDITAEKKILLNPPEIKQKISNQNSLF